MVALRSQHALQRLDELRRELTDLAFLLDRRGQPAAADVALAVANRLGEVSAECEGLAPARSGLTSFARSSRAEEESSP